MPYFFARLVTIISASCGILYILVLSLVIFMQSLYPILIIYEIFHLLVIMTIIVCSLTIIVNYPKVSAVIELLIISSTLRRYINSTSNVTLNFSIVNYYHIKAGPGAHRQCEIGVHEDYIIYKIIRSGMIHFYCYTDYICIYC